MLPGATCRHCTMTAGSNLSWHTALESQKPQDADSRGGVGCAQVIEWATHTALGGWQGRKVRWMLYIGFWLCLLRIFSKRDSCQRLVMTCVAEQHALCHCRDPKRLDRRDAHKVCCTTAAGCCVSASAQTATAVELLLRKCNQHLLLPLQYRGSKARTASKKSTRVGKAGKQQRGQWRGDS